MTDSSENIPTKFVQTPSFHLKCPECGGLYQDPVISIKCGHTFCRKCVFRLKECPLDNTHCDTSQIVENRLVVGQIEELQIHCRHGLRRSDKGEWGPHSDLCSEIISFGKRGEHENSCPFALVPCPNSKLCGQLHRKNLEDHMVECVHRPCPHNKQGCTFSGNEKEVKNHSTHCRFQWIQTGSTQQDAIMKQILCENKELSLRTAKLEHDKQRLESELEKLQGTVRNIEQKLDLLCANIDQLKPSPSRHSIPSSQALIGNGDSSSAGSVSSSQSHILSGHSARNYEKWEMPFQFKCIGTLRGHRDVVWSMTTRRGRLYSGGADGIIKVWSLEQLAKGCINNINAHEGVIHCLASWGNCLISAGADKAVRLWDLDSGIKRASFEEAHDNIICSLLTLEDILFTSSFSVLKVWDLKSQSLKKTLTGRTHWIRALAVNKDKDKLYSGSHNAVEVWDIQSLQQLTPIKHECGVVYSLAVNSTYVIAGTYNQNIQVFDGNTHEFVMNLCGHIGAVTTLITSPSGRFLFSASDDSNIQMWSLEKLLPIQALSRHQGAVNTLTLHGDFLLSGSEDHEIKVFRYFQIQ